MNYYIKSSWAQVQAELLRTFRNRRFIFFSILMPAAFFFLFTAVVGGSDVPSYWSAYYLMSMTSYGVVGASLVTFSQRISKERSAGWIRLLRLSPLPSGSYVLSKIAAQGAINLILILTMFLLGRVGKSVHLSWSIWLEAGLWIWVGGFAFMALGLFLGSMKNSDVVQMISMALYMSLSIVGGLWMPLSSLPSVLQNIAKFTPTYRMGEGPWALVEGRALDWTGIAILSMYIILFMVLSSYIMKRQEAI
ncbi:ABC-2 type transport system permease protein [Paenibacillus shirakamiensis]|uniref:ABC-2 type transport system permease protein n=1 Tax=Paenibacillus shirakamiensis TaxID=1265935 RepID=A0ABS4JKH5_9BACL|nr:ABC transporter permease [Paenibacillus shirakamiensis]MBP2002212.1 ABC-2 type transport system permease protein [Paenibacillus shirakamiensis]